MTVTAHSSDQFAEKIAREEITAALLIIGDEILSGRTKDKNIGFIADHCTLIGIRLKEVRVVADDELAIIAAVNTLRSAYTYVFTTGGIGPTHDDITADSIARAFGVSIDVDPRAVALMLKRYPGGNADLTPARLRMARIPEGATLVENSVSAPPGFMLDNVIVMAGIPVIMQSMLLAVTPSLRTGEKMISETIRANAPEGLIAAPLAEAQRAFPEVAMGSYPFSENGQYGAHLVLRSTDDGLLQRAKADLISRLGPEISISE